jgi:hypothetical protein
MSIMKGYPQMRIYMLLSKWVIVIGNDIYNHLWSVYKGYNFTIKKIKQKLKIEDECVFLRCIDGYYIGEINMKCVATSYLNQLYGGGVNGTTNECIWRNINLWKIKRFKRFKKLKKLKN